MLEELWERREALEDRLSDDLDQWERVAVQRDLGHVEEALGIGDELPVRTGDPVADWLLRRQISGEITPEDLLKTPEEIRRIVAKEQRGRRR